MDTAAKSPTGLEVIHKALLFLKEGKPEECQRVLEEAAGTNPPPRGVIVYRDFEASFHTARRKNNVPAAAYIIFEQHGVDTERVRTITGGHARAQATLDSMIRDAVLFNRTINTLYGGAPAAFPAEGGNA